MDTLRDLRDRDHPMDLERAKTVATVASVLVDTAKVENEFLKITGESQSSFLAPSMDGAPPRIPHTDGPSAHQPFPVSAQHRLVG
jgi:hypothetical protein